MPRQNPRAPRRHPAAIRLRIRATARVLLLLALSAGLGCAAIQHGIDARKYAGEPLSPRSARGAQRFAAELAVDSTLTAYVAEHGRPDFFYLLNRNQLYFFYVDHDRAAKFERVLVEGSQVTELGRIPGSLLKLLPEATRTRVTAQRAVGQRRAQAKARRAKAQAARQTPRRRGAAAAIAPSGAYIGGFEVDRIVARMREPLTAADPGVSGWRQSRLRGGGIAYTAKAGSARYEVGPSRVALSIGLAATRSSLPGSARRAIHRVNSAIFGAKASAVSDKINALAERAAADRSGRTAFSKRVAGRTIRIGRRLDAGVLAYSIHP